MVGNESIDQLSKFNEGLKEGGGREVDGVVVSKFDAVDDKVGAVLSMSFITGKPVFFVGVGQTYTDLKRMNVQSVVDTLLAP